MESLWNTTITDPLLMVNESWSSVPVSTPEGRVTSLVRISPVLIQMYYYVIAIAGVLGNGFVVLVMVVTPDLHDVTNYLITNQSVIDLLASLVFLLLHVVFVDPDPRDLSENRFVAQFVCRVWRSNYTYWALVRVSAANLMCLTAERYFAVCRAVAYRKYVRKHRIVVVVIFVWIVGLAYQLPMLVFHNVHEDGECRLIWPTALSQGFFGFSILLTQLIIPMSLMTFVYIRIWSVLRRRVNPGVTGHFAMRAKQNVIKTLFIVAVVYTICWTPILTFFAFFSAGVQGAWGSTLHFVFLAFGYTNSVVNPFIYAYKYRKFQDAVKNAFRCKKSSQVNVETLS